jgi:hypothetical protein
VWQKKLGGVETDHVQYAHRSSAEWFVLNRDVSSVQESNRNPLGRRSQQRNPEEMFPNGAKKHSPSH